MKSKKMTITVKIPKPRDFNLINAQLKGLLRTKIIRNKKKDVKKYNWKKDMSYYLSILTIKYFNNKTYA